MNKPVYEKNMEALRGKYPVWAYLLENKKRKKRNFDVIAEQSLMGDTILKVNQDGKILYLNGKYAPSAVVERWFEAQGTIEGDMSGQTSILSSRISVPMRKRKKLWMRHTVTGRHGQGWRC